ncbi:MAG: Signal peptidase I T [Lentisphaerae bacterium ADurb.Bin242]|nr:MAG: Signal peptidase I T [Lentisphaerae bacterium ADurb.Bin242]
MLSDFFMNYFKKRKLKKQLHELKSSVSFTLAADDDILEDSTRAALEKLKRELDVFGKKPSLSDAPAIACCEDKLGRILPRKGFAHSMHNFLDILVVACSVAGGVRALYLQPFSIPTSSMQPTLFGIHYIDREASSPFMGPVTRGFMPLQARRAALKVRSDGLLSDRYQQWNRLFFFPESYFQIGSDSYTLPGDLFPQIVRYLKKTTPFYSEGETFCDGWLSTGDHVLVERFSIHFRKLKRGDVIVFNTETISSPTQPLGGYYYIKRLVGLPGDTLQISDNILMIRPKGEKEFRPAWEFSDKFRKVYSLNGGYQGHRADGLLALGGELTVPDGFFFALGDNTNNSLDGRNWGFIPRRNMVGLAMFIFWPVSRRWGVVDTLPPLDVPTVMPSESFFQPQAMSMQ